MVIDDLNGSGTIGSTINMCNHIDGILVVMEISGMEKGVVINDYNQSYWW